MKHLSLSALALAGLVFFSSCKKDDDNGGGGGNTTPTVSTLGCGTATFSPSTATPNQAYTGTATVPYLGGNGAAYAAGSAISSTGVTGLTATLKAGTLASGTGNIVFDITGTPSGNGAASFAISFGGQTCNLNFNVGQGAPSLVGKWYYQSVTDSAFCCKNLPSASRYAYPDSNATYTITPNTFYVQYLADKSFTELYFDNQTYPGNYTTGYSSFLGADSLNRDYGSGYVEYYRINSLGATSMQLRDRITFYQNDSTGSGVLPNGDTLVYRRIWTYNKL